VGEKKIGKRTFRTKMRDERLAKKKGCKFERPTKASVLTLKKETKIPAGENDKTGRTTLASGGGRN